MSEPTIGRRICDILKDIRKDVSNTTNIDLNQSECTHKGECTGTCPKCESELDKINTTLSHEDLVAKINSLANQARIDRENTVEEPEDTDPFDLIDDIYDMGEEPEEPEEPEDMNIFNNLMQ
jgi:ferredoxin